MVNSSPFQQGLQQQPPAPVSQTNQQTNYHVRPQQFNHNPSPQVSPLLTQPQQFSMHIPQPFNPQVPPPTFHSIHLLTAHLSIFYPSSFAKLFWEKQERLDRECIEMEKQKEKRKWMKEEREQRKEEQN